MGEPEIAEVAALFANRARAQICTTLMDGRFHTAGELARAAEVSASTASEHLALLVAAGAVEATRQGRHRYFRLAGSEVAAVVESLSVVARRGPVTSLRQSRAARQLREGRTCYDHLAGRLGVVVTEGLVRLGVLTDQLAVDDLAPLAPLGLDVAARRGSPLARPCVDWTERTHHLAGPVAAGLLHRLLALEWLMRPTGDRAICLTEEGRAGLSALGLLEARDDAPGIPKTVNTGRGA